MAGISKRERVDRVLAANARIQANLGVDSTLEERVEARRKWVDMLAKIYEIDPARAMSLKGDDEFDAQSIVGKMVKAVSKSGNEDERLELIDRISSVFSRSHELFPLEFVLESFQQIGIQLDVKWNVDGWVVCDFATMEDDTRPTVREALTHYLNS